MSFQIKVHIVFNRVYVSYLPFLIEEGQNKELKIFQTTPTAEESLRLEFEKNANIQLPLALVEAAF